MRNFELAIFLIVAGLFLQGCDPMAEGNFFIKSKDILSANTDNRMLEVTKVVELIARRSGFTPTSDHIGNIRLSMQKRNKDGLFTCISVVSEDNIVKIYIDEFGHDKLSEDALRLQNEIADKLNQLLEDCCIITKDNKYSRKR